MLRKGSPYLAALTAALALAACGKKATPENSAPLAFVPADAPYVMANREPMPEAAIKQWRAQMQEAWPLVVPMLDDLVKQTGGEAPQVNRVLKALVDEMRTRNTPELWEQVGLGPKVRVAIYGVGLLPVLRLELTNVEAFKAMFERVEAASGTKLQQSRIGAQEVRSFDADELTGLIAFEGSHLVVTFVPKDADEAFKRRMLGLDRPAQSFLDTDALAAFDKAHGYLPYGSGWIDMRRVVALAGTPAAGIGKESVDATCRAEFDAIAAKMPRLSFGYTRMDGNEMGLRARLELEPALAKALVDLGGTIPGSPRKDALIDIAFALPVLKARDFIVAQADAVAKAPFQCKDLAKLDAEFAEAKVSLDRVIPPPFADLTGLRITLDQLAFADGLKQGPSEVAGMLLYGSNNPLFLVGLAQMGVPALQKLHLNPDGKPVALPTEALGPLAGKYEVQAAMGAKTLGIAVGKTAIANLASAVMQAPTSDGTVMSFDASGRVYTLMSELFGNPSIVAMMPAEQQHTMELQRKLYALYAQWFKHLHMRLAFVPEGIDFIETVEFNPPAAGAAVAQ